MQNTFRLNYKSSKIAEIERKDNIIIYSAVPHRKDNEYSAKVLLEWDGKKWCAFVEGKYNSLENSMGFNDGVLSLNQDACEIICKVFKINIKKCNDKTLIDSISKTSPSDLEKYVKYQKENLISS